MMLLSAGHGFVFIAFLVIAGIPFWKIVKRTGMPRGSPPRDHVRCKRPQ